MVKPLYSEEIDSSLGLDKPHVNLYDEDEKKERPYTTRDYLEQSVILLSEACKIEDNSGIGFTFTDVVEKIKNKNLAPFLYSFLELAFAPSEYLKTKEGYWARHQRLPQAYKISALEYLENGNKEEFMKRILAASVRFSEEVAHDIAGFEKTHIPSAIDFLNDNVKQ